MVDHRLRHWANIKPTLRVSCTVSQQTRHVDPMLGQLCPTVYDAEPTLAQQWVNVLCLRAVMIWTGGGVQ